MKYYHYILSSIVCLLVTASCSQDNNLEPENNNEKKAEVEDSTSIQEYDYLMRVITSSNRFVVRKKSYIKTSVFSPYYRPNVQYDYEFKSDSTGTLSIYSLTDSFKGYTSETKDFIWEVNQTPPYNLSIKVNGEPVIKYHNISVNDKGIISDEETFEKELSFNRFGLRLSSFQQYSVDDLYVQQFTDEYGDLRYWISGAVVTLYRNNSVVRLIKTGDYHTGIMLTGKGSSNSKEYFSQKLYFEVYWYDDIKYPILYMPWFISDDKIEEEMKNNPGSTYIPVGIYYPSTNELRTMENGKKYNIPFYNE